MPNSTVERYELLLAENPAAPVFTDLAKALIHAGEYTRAIEVCQGGLAHHPQSVLGQVLLGNALIGSGRAAEAMQQFDQAIRSERENVRVYVLISKVLIQRSLYRSAVPLLKKALSLQPENVELAQLLDDTGRAARGGPPPIVDGKVFLDDEELKSSPAAAAEVTGDFDPAQLPQRKENGAEPERPEADTDSRPAAATLPEVPVLSGRERQPPPLTKGHVRSRSELLHDVPDVLEAEITAELPKARVSSHEAEQAARQYEQELRQELQQSSEAAKKSFLARHWLKIAAATVAAVMSVVAVASYLAVRAAHQGRDLKDDLAQAKKAITQDTLKSYQFALGRLFHALDMDSNSEEAWALAAYVHGILYVEHASAPEDLKQGRAALERPGVRERFPGLALATEFYLAEPPRKQELRKALLETKLDQPEIHELVGRILLSRNDSKDGLERFRRALTASPTNVRALVALGDYYRESGDHLAALKFYATAAQISPRHPGRLIGAAESRLELSTELEDALKELEELATDQLLAPELQARKELVHGKLLARGGKSPAAIQRLSDAANRFKFRAFDFQLALGEANRAAGRWDDAQKWFEAALASNPRAEEPKEWLGKVLIAKDREREVLSRFSAEPESRKVSLVRGMALAKLGEWKRARLELSKTQLNGKIPTEAAIYLALADATEGQADRAQSVLEKLLAASRKVKGDVRIALGTVYWQRGAMDKARSQFEEAVKESDDYEGACALGRLLVALGSLEAAIEPLGKAVSRNPWHGEANKALGRTYLELGKIQEALALFHAWRALQPTSAEAHKNWALALYHAGKMKDGEAAIAEALRLDSSDGEAHRIQAALLFASGELARAFRELEKGSKLRPHDPEIWCDLGAAYARQGRADSAAKAYQVARGENGEAFCSRIGAHYAHLQSGSRADAKELIEMAQKAPQFWNKALAFSTASRLLLANGAVKEACKVAEQAIATAPRSADGYLALGLAEMRLKEEAKAREQLEKAVELEPGYAAAHLALADLLIKDEGTRSLALGHYRAFQRIGGAPSDQNRVKRTLASLKKKVALR